MILSPIENRQIDSLVETVMNCLSFLTEQCEHSADYKYGIRHTIEHLIALKVSEITLSSSIDSDSVNGYLNFGYYETVLSTPHTIERNNEVRERIKVEVIEYLQFIDENLNNIPEGEE